jgi:hypothetical protein
MAQQIKKKFIGNDQVGANQLLVEKNQAVRGTLQNDSVVDLVKLNASDEVFLKGIKVLDGSDKIPAAILPSYVDDVLEYANLAAFPATGETGKIYVALDTNKCFRWSGSTYIQITSGAVDSVNGSTGVVVLDAGDIVMVSEATTIESKLVSLQGEVDATEDDISHLVTLSGVAVDSDSLGSFTGSTIPDAQTIKQAFQSLELAHEEVDQNANDLISLSGVAENAVNLGSFTGSTISDSQTIKQAFQELETAHEGHLNDASGAHAASAISLSPAVNGETEVQGALEDHESRIDSLETAMSPTWGRVKFDLTATNISNGYVDLTHEAIGESIHAFVDRLAIHQGEDFSISVVGGVTRITFTGDLVSPGQSSLDASDNIYVRYQYMA